MSAPPRRSVPPRRRSGRAIEIWLIALLVALVATVQIRSQAEVERSLVGTDTTTLAFLIDDLHRANDALSAESGDLAQRKTALQSGGSPAAEQELTAEANRLRAIEGLVPVHGPGIVMVVDASGLQALDLQDAVNNLAAAGAEAIAVNDHRVIVGIPIEQTQAGVTIDGALVLPPWTISVIGDANRLAAAADLMTQQMRGDRRVRLASYRVEADVEISAVVTARRRLEGEREGDGRIESGLRLHLATIYWSGATLTRSRLRCPSSVKSFQLCRQLVDALVEAIHVVPAGDAEPSQCALDGLIDHRFKVTSAPLDLVDEVPGDVEGLAHVVEQRLSAVVDGVGARIHQSGRPPFLDRQRDLGEDDLRQVLARIAVDDLDLVTVAHQVSDAFERYVPAGLGVIKLAICVLLDKVSIGCHRQVSTVISSQY